VATGNAEDLAYQAFGETVLKLAPRSLSLVGYFAPSSVFFDQDLGSAGPIVLPDGQHVVQGGKDGKVYLLNGNALPSTPPVQGDPSAEVFFAVDPENAHPDAPSHHIHSGEALWQSPSGLNFYVWGENAPLHVYRYDPSSQLLETSPIAIGNVTPPTGMPGGNLTTSGIAQSGHGIVWAAMPLQYNSNNSVVPGVLRASDAETAQQIWSSDVNPGDDIGEFPKFNPPTIVNGKVYVPSFSHFVSVFGPRTGPTPPIANGAYQVRTTVASSSCLDANSSNPNAGTVERTCNQSTDQRWQFTDVGNNRYQIQNTGSGRCLAVAGGNAGDGVSVLLAACSGISAQQWAVTSLGNGQYTISPQTQVPGGPVECLNVAISQPTDGTQIWQWECDGTTASFFTLAVDNYGPPAFPDGTYRLTTSVAPTPATTCVAGPGGDKGPFPAASQASCDGLSDQRWRFRNVGGSTYEIRSAANDYCLDAGINPSSGSPIPQQPCTGANSQHWQVQRVGSGRYMFQSYVGMSIVSSGGQIVQSYSGGPGLSIIAP
jgi:hypothetical protein